MNNEELSAMAIDVLDIEMQILVHKNQLFDLRNQTTVHPRIKYLFKKVEHLLRKAERIQNRIRVSRNGNDQALLLKAFEIVGLPDDAVKNNNDLAKILTNILKTPIQERMIERFEILYAHRVQRQNPICQPAKIMAVHMGRRHYRNRILHLAGSAPLQLQGSAEPLYISEHLTYMTRMTFIKTMQMAVQHNIELVWISNGKIYAQKTQTSPFRYRIRCEADIKKILSD